MSEADAIVRPHLIAEALTNGLRKKKTQVRDDFVQCFPFVKGPPVFAMNAAIAGSTIHSPIEEALCRPTRIEEAARRSCRAIDFFSLSL